jgi:hypothetical protein
MRNILKTLGVISIIAFSASVFAANSVEGKIGVGSIKDADNRTGFDAALAYNFELDRFFELSPEIGFNWINFDKGTGITQTVGATTAELKETRNHYTIPMLLNARIYPMKFGEEGTKPIFAPFISIGAGYAWMVYKSETPATTTAAAITSNQTFGGFAYQAMVGAIFALGDPEAGAASAVDIITEVGYRGGDLEKNNLKINFSGFVARVGVRYGF